MLANRVKESSTTTGVGPNLTLAGTTAPGFQTFTSQFAVNDRFTYTIENISGQWEIGVGYLSSATVLVREGVLENSEGTTVAIDFTGTLTVFVSMSTFESQNVPYVTADLRSVGTRLDGIIGGSAFNTVVNIQGAIYLAGYFFTGRKISYLGVRVQVNDTGDNSTKIALYKLSDSGLPGDIMAETGLLSATPSGFIWGSITPIFAPAGAYYMAVLTTSATAQFSGSSLNNTCVNFQSCEEFRPRIQPFTELGVSVFSDNPTVVSDNSFSNIPDLRTRA